MSAIRETPDLDATRLAAVIAFDRSTMGDVLERLEAKGWVIRTPSPADRRIKRLGLSQAGLALLDTVQPAVQRVQAQLLAPFAAHEHAAVLDMLRRLSAEIS